MQNMARSVFYCYLANHSLYKFLHHWFNYVIQNKERSAASSMKICPIRKFLIVKVEIASESTVFIFLKDWNRDPNRWFQFRSGIVHPCTSHAPSYDASGFVRVPTDDVHSFLLSYWSILDPTLNPILFSTLELCDSQSATSSYIIYISSNKKLANVRYLSIFYLLNKK